MGTIHHHSIVVTCWNPSYLKKAHEQATKIFDWVSPISPEVVNGYTSFFIPPDGSKEGWGASNLGESLRTGFINWLNKEMTYEDHAHKVEWVEVGFGEYGYEVGRSNESERLRVEALVAQQLADRKADDEKWAALYKEAVGYKAQEEDS